MKLMKMDAHKLVLITHTHTHTHIYDTVAKTDVKALVKTEILKVISHSFDAQKFEIKTCGFAYLLLL